MFYSSTIRYPSTFFGQIIIQHSTWSMITRVSSGLRMRHINGRKFHHVEKFYTSVLLNTIRSYQEQAWRWKFSESFQWRTNLIIIAAWNPITIWVKSRSLIIHWTGRGVPPVIFFRCSSLLRRVNLWITFGINRFAYRKLKKGKLDPFSQLKSAR